MTVMMGMKGRSLGMMVAALVAVLVVLVTAGGVAGAADEPPRPNIAPRFKAKIYDITNGFPVGKGQFYYDLHNKSSVYYIEHLEPITGLYLNTSILNLKDVAYYNANRMCKKIPDAAFYDMFNWVHSKYAKYNGKKTIEGQECDEWSLASSNAALSLCANGNTPVMTYVYSVKTVSTQEYIYETFEERPSPFDESVFAVPEECTGVPPLCPGKEETTVLDAYIFHPKSTTGNIVNQDVADLLGDIVFICVDAIDNHTSIDQYAYVSKYKIEAVAKWGQYEQCNGYPGVCLGDNGPAVGREASYGVKELGGQCANNSDVGSWYSLPKAGLCPPGEPLSLANNCTWRIKSRVKTIDGTCLLKEQGMLDSCRDELHVPFPKTTEILTKAFERNKKEQGGCPNIVPH